LQLTDFGQFDDLCAGCPLRGFLCDGEDILDILDILRSGTFAEIMALYDDVSIDWHEITYQDVIDNETGLAWEEYKPATNLTEAEEDDHDSAEEPPSLAQRLHDMEWILPAAQRVQRRSGLYRTVQDHGTAAQRRGRNTEDRRRKRQARRNRHTPHYTPAHKFRDYRTDLVTWGTAEDRFEDDHKPSWEDMWFDNSGFGLYDGLYDPYETNELDLFDRNPVLATGYYDEDEDDIFGYGDPFATSSRYSPFAVYDRFDW